MNTMIRLEEPDLQQAEQIGTVRILPGKQH